MNLTKMVSEVSTVVVMNLKVLNVWSRQVVVTSSPFALRELVVFEIRGGGPFEIFAGTANHAVLLVVIRRSERVAVTVKLNRFIYLS